MKRKKIMQICTNFIISFLVCSSVVLASQTDDAVESINGGTGVYKTLLQIMSIMSWLGVAIAVFKLMHIGIKYITQPAGGRGQAKESFIPWAIGAFVLATFGTLAPWLIGTIEPSNKDIFDI